MQTCRLQCAFGKCVIKIAEYFQRWAEIDYIFDTQPRNLLILTPTNNLQARIYLALHGSSILARNLRISRKIGAHQKVPPWSGIEVGGNKSSSADKERQTADECLPHHSFSALLGCSGSELIVRRNKFRLDSNFPLGFGNYFWFVSTCIFDPVL